MSDTSGSSAKGSLFSVGDYLARKAYSIAQYVSTLIPPNLPLIFLADRQWADNELGPVDCPIGSTIIASNTVVCAITGELRCIITGVVSNNSVEDAATASIGISTGATATPLVYTQAVIDLPGDAQVSFSLVVDLDRLNIPIIAPHDGVTPFQVNAVMTITGTGCAIPNFGVQFECQELLS